ncbi:MAG: outer membrane beta-barrel protein [Cyclobacteriaceae bacterium]
MEGRERTSSYQEIYKLQYLQIPGIVSFYTNEIALDTRLYFQVGVELEIKISEKDDAPNQIFVSDFKTFNMSSVLGMGVELTQGTSTVLAVGLGYHRSLNNVASSRLPIDGTFAIKPDVVSVDFTLWF